MKTFRIIGFALFAILMSLSACSSGGDEPIEPTPKPEITKSEITIDSSIITNGLSFTNKGGEQSISFTTNESWTLSVASTTSGTTWCTASTTSGTKGNASVKFSVSENTDYDNRSVSVTIKSGTATKTFTVSQKGVDALLITTDKYEINQEGGTIEIEVKANINYKMEISEKAKDWIKESSSRGLASYKHSLDIAMNEDSEKREGVIYFKSGDKTETVKIYQAGGAILLLSQNEFNVSDKGDTISIDIKSNIEFGVQMPDVDWIVDLASSRGLSSHTLKYYISPNDSYENRNAQIIYYSKNNNLSDTINIVQNQNDAIILSTTEYNVDFSGDTIEVILKSNVKFEISIDSDWVKQIDNSSSRVLTTHSLFFEVDKNTKWNNRTTKITITDIDKNIVQTITIKQKPPKTSAEIPQINGKTLRECVNSHTQKIRFIANSTTSSIYAKKIAEGVFVTDTNSVVTVHINTDYANLVSPQDMFRDFNKLKVIEGLGFLNTCNATDMGSMFEGCSSLTSLDLSNFDTSNVLLMNGMFRNCLSLSSLDVSDFNTSKVNNMDFMFAECSSLTSLDLSNFDTGNVTGMSGLFYKCSSISSLDLSTFKTSKVKDMWTMFGCCSSLESLNLSKFDTSNVTNMNQMFEGCSSLISLDLSNFDTGKVSQMRLMFTGCSSLTSLAVSNFNTSNVTDMRNMFEDCSSLTSLDLTSFNTSNVTDMQKIFYGCTSLSTLNLSSFNTAGLTDMSNMFSKCSSLTSIDLSSFTLTKVESMENMFSDCVKLKYLKMMSNPVLLVYTTKMFDGVKTKGEFYYNNAYKIHYKKNIDSLPKDWKAISCSDE